MEQHHCFFWDGWIQKKVDTYVSIRSLNAKTKKSSLTFWTSSLKSETDELLKTLEEKKLEGTYNAIYEELHEQKLKNKSLLNQQNFKAFISGFVLHFIPFIFYTQNVLKYFTKMNRKIYVFLTHPAPQNAGHGVTQQWSGVSQPEA